MDPVKVIADLLAVDLVSFDYIQRTVAPLFDDYVPRNKVEMHDMLESVDPGELSVIIKHTDLELMHSYVGVYRDWN